MTDFLCPKCGTITDDLDVVGDNEVLYRGKFFQISLWLAKETKDKENETMPLLLEFDNVAVGVTFEEFQDVVTGIMKAKPLVEKRMENLK